ncbi:NlpC/P60 family protein [Sedimenticola thiotaurini]|uniref:NlpC/P60 domain-containing protein n=1 Tax=Sedimenticola thiotaurini TaxID=1543721 RepID=A0A0F7K087_9GAMM|nr:NlpC/P60 family protein [Sedimenticola thiotaurini]AKH21019.1 hypothetical protein AAY24_12395 [Sedimenticola thiotaurini]
MSRLLLIPLLLLISACSHEVLRPANTAGNSMAVGQQTLETRQALLDRLYQQHQEWRGTPYRLGGQSRQGIDCSGFVQLTYHTHVGVSLPRTTAQQANMGQPVQQAELTTGDLVFFMIDGNTRHVGIYLEQNRFLHASKSSGVIISPLDSPYWRAAYWRSRRVL